MNRSIQNGRGNARPVGRTRFSLAAVIGRAASRHGLTLLVAAGLVYLFGVVHEHWSPMHRWNKATADASHLPSTSATYARDADFHQAHKRNARLHLALENVDEKRCYQRGNDSHCNQCHHKHRDKPASIP
jgi:hypothetical protein